MNDQATILRGLMEQKRSMPTAVEPSMREATATTICVTSGKGGVGKSNIALNLAIAFAESDARVCILDANLGLGNIDLLCGLNGYWNLSHVIAGARSLPDIILDGPRGIHVIPGASGLADVADCTEPAQANLLNQMEDLERSHDFLILDTGAGIHRPVRQFVASSDVALIVATPEPTAIADAYATIKTLSTVDGPRLEILINRSETHNQARAIVARIQQTARIFLKTDVGPAGSIPADPSVPRAVVRRAPFLIETPHAAASQSIRQLARRLKNCSDTHPAQGHFFGRLWSRFSKEEA